MNKAIQQAIEFAREGKNQEASALIEQELRLHPGNGLAWAIRAQLADDREDRLEFLNRALELAPSDRVYAWLRREIERVEPPVLDPYPGDPVPSPHTFDIAFLEDDTDRSLKTQAIPAPEQKPRWRGCLNLLIAVVVLVIAALAATIFLVPTLRQMIQPNEVIPAKVAEEPTTTVEPTATEEPTATSTPTPTSTPTHTPSPTQPPATPTPVVSDLIPLAESWTLTGPELRPNDLFAEALAIAGQTVIAGQPAHGPTGGVHVYVLADQGWEWEAAINPEAAGYVGGVVAADGDTIIMGDWETGDAYVYIYDGISWHEQGLLPLPEERDSDYSGSAVAISGDTAVVGVPSMPLFETSNRGDEGTVLIFTRRGGIWTQQAVINPPEEETRNRGWFGLQVALDQDTLVITGNDLQNSAVAYVYQRSGSEWEYRATLEAGEYPRDVFNTSLDISGRRIALGLVTLPDEDLSPVVLYEDVSQAGDWSEVEQTGVPRPVDTLYAPDAPDEQVEIWTTAAIDGDQIVFAGIAYKDDIAVLDRDPGTTYLCVFENGEWNLTHQIEVANMVPHFIAWELDLNDGLLAIGGKDLDRIGQILIYDLRDITTE